MINFLKSRIVIFIELVAIIFAIFWYLDTKEIEPVITCLLIIAGLVAPIIIKTKECAQVEVKLLTNGKINGNFRRERIENNVEIGVRKITWKYKIRIINNSKYPVLRGEFYYKSKVSKLSFKKEDGGSFDVPIDPLKESVILFELSKDLEGTIKDLDTEYDKAFPDEVVNDLIFYLKYDCNVDRKVKNIYSIRPSGHQVIVNKIKSLPEEVKKVKI